ncbi:ADP-ribosyl glycohydrolase [Cladorrhinum sp. PSN332]|nr:ADP-ribosyl glycohydrolase [Cladorrhinum sp. PSN332]
MVAAPLTKHDRVLGALLGVHAGDCLGAPLEFRAWENIKAKHPTGQREITSGGPWAKGEATDDTDMMRAVLLAYYDQVRYSRQDQNDPDNGKDVAGRAASYFVDWYNGDWPGRTKGTQPKDVGIQTRQALNTLIRDRNKDHTRCGVRETQDGRTAGNGGLMRCIPTGLFQDDTNLIETESIAINNITHIDSESALSCVVYNIMVHHLINGVNAGEAFDAGMAVVQRWLRENRPNSYRHKAAVKVQRVMNAGRNAINLADFANLGPSRAANWKEFMPGLASGYVADSLLLAVAALFDARSLEDILVDVVRVGHDTDTNAAIAGGLLGARDGVNAIPQRWLSAPLQFRDEFEAVAEYLLEPAPPAPAQGG